MRLLATFHTHYVNPFSAGTDFRRREFKKYYGCRYNTGIQMSREFTETFIMIQIEKKKTFGLHGLYDVSVV